MHRRDVLKAGAALAAVALPDFAVAQGAAASAAPGFAPKPGAWRSFAVTTRLEIAKPEGRTQAWVPVPSVNEEAWFRSLDTTFTSNGKAALVRDPKYGAGMIHVEWAAGETAPFVEVISKVATRDRAVDLAAPSRPAALSAAERALYTEGTDLILVDGIVKQTADKITSGARDDAAKAKAIYEWIVDNTFRDPATRGCGIGDIAAMLKTGHLGGKCADLNALYVGLARASGLPARDVYGIRLAPSAFGYKSLGAGSEVITKAQHCRAEVWLEAFGWVPVDPADVRKVVLEEPPTRLAIDDPKVVAARRALFGSWETNWLAYNVAHDLALPGAQGPKIGFLMYPQAETASQRLDCLDPDGFRYVIRAKETTAT
ncbi:transglutaminase-like domain-containing protein [Rhodoplanes sp. SY1]|uniref:transglutaminase-like domain-containing protein n=1 Tax=Rhodoplanes sp. SY1 TaxID=3166646 RepID=UPI0038B5FF11